MESGNNFQSDELTLQAPEQIQLHLELAGLGSRFIAAFIDTLLQAILIMIMAVAVGYMGLIIGESTIGTVVVLLSAMLIVIIYFVTFELLWSGQSPGKRVAGLMVIRADGGPVGFTESAIRNILRFVDILPGVYTVGLVSAFATRNLQRLGDLAAGTVVVKVRDYDVEQLGHERETAAQGPASSGKRSDDLVAVARRDIRDLDKEQLETIRRFGERRHELAAPVRQQIAGRIADKLRHEFPALSEDRVPNPERFLHIVYQAYLNLHRG